MSQKLEELFWSDVIKNFKCAVRSSNRCFTQHRKDYVRIKMFIRLCVCFGSEFVVIVRLDESSMIFTTIDLINRESTSHMSAI